MILVVMILAALGVGEPPGLTEGMVAGAVADDAPGDAAANTLLLNERLRASHPSGSLEADLVDALLAEGFDVRAGTGFASLHRMDWLCDLSFEVSWTAKGGVLASVEGSAGGVCM